MQPQGTPLLNLSNLCAHPVEADSELIKSTLLAGGASPVRVGFVDLSRYPFDAISMLGWVHKPSRLIKLRFN